MLTRWDSMVHTGPTSHPPRTHPHAHTPAAPHSAPEPQPPDADTNTDRNTGDGEGQAETGDAEVNVAFFLTDPLKHAKPASRGSPRHGCFALTMPFLLPCTHTHPHPHAGLMVVAVLRQGCIRPAAVHPWCAPEHHLELCQQPGARIFGRRALGFLQRAPAVRVRQWPTVSHRLAQRRELWARPSLSHPRRPHAASLSPPFTTRWLH